MKNTLVTSYKELITNRYLTVLTIVTILLAVGFVLYIALAVRPSELQQVTHYTAFGVTHLYRDQWFYLLSFAAFAIIAAFMHIAVSIKLYLTKGHPLALTFAWLGIGVLVFGWLTSVWLINILTFA
jgi:hypothetical protein